MVSALALYPPLLRVAEIIIREHNLEGHVLAPEEGPAPRVYRSAGRFSAEDFDPLSSPLTVHFLPASRGHVENYGFDRAPLRRLLQNLDPDYLWIHGEFAQGLCLQLLRLYRFRRRPKIVAYVAINHVPGPHPLFSRQWPFLSRTRLKHVLLWPRLDGVAACATKSLKCARRMGLPATVPVLVNYLPVFGPEDAAQEGISLPWSQDGAVIVGFAGSITEQKGWKVLLMAMESLPDRFKVIIAGDGEQREELLAWLERPSLRQRTFFIGVLPKERLLATYPLFDVLVLPAITTPHSVEQFGAVLAEAMACGVPVIGSDSGAIPETVGWAGLIVPEGDPQALVQAILHLSADEALRQRSVAWGRERYAMAYSCEAYAKSMTSLLFGST